MTTESIASNTFPEPNGPEGRFQTDEENITIEVVTVTNTAESDISSMSYMLPGESAVEASSASKVAELATLSSTDLVESAATEDASWWKRNKSKVYLGAAGIGLAGTVTGIANGSFSEMTEEISAEAPWVVGSMVASEALFIGGIAGMAAGAGREIGNPLKLRGRMPEVLAGAAGNSYFRAGLTANTVGALGSAGVIAAGAVKALPPETWPGAFSLAALDVASTVSLRVGAYKAMQASGEKTKSAEKKPEINVRLAQVEDIDRLADLDLELFSKAYGEEMPVKADVIEMLTARHKNGGDSMFVAEVDGRIEGFVSCFITDTTIDDFESWETSTANGTLEGKVSRDAKQVYITNMTISPIASKAGGKEILMANMFAYGIEQGVEYGYFESRMPSFRRWADREVRKGTFDQPDETSLQAIAEEYMNTRRPDGKRRDPQLAMYEGFGFDLARVVPEAFQDHDSLNFGVICKAAVPMAESPLYKLPAFRKAMASGLRFATKWPKLLEKVL